MQLTTVAILKTFTQLKSYVVIEDHSFLFKVYLFVISPASVPGCYLVFSAWFIGKIGFAALDHTIFF